MSGRSVLLSLVAIGLIGAVVLEETSARGRLFGKRFARFGVSRSSSWGGSYGRTGSCGTPIARSCSTTTQVKTQVCSFGSAGGSGGAYVSTGSSGGLIVSSSTSPKATTTISKVVVKPEPKVVEQAKVDDKPAHKHIVTGDADSHGKSVLSPTVAHVAPQATTHAYLLLRNVPASAEIYLLGVKMTARGALRKYRIPLHSDGQDYDYDIELKMNGATEFAASATAKVRAGETTELWVSNAGEELVFLNDGVEVQDIPLALR